MLPALPAPPRSTFNPRRAVQEVGEYSTIDYTVRAVEGKACRRTDRYRPTSSGSGGVVEVVQEHAQVE